MTDKDKKIGLVEDCPFCGIKCHHDELDSTMYHPHTGDCIMDGARFVDIKWNRRAKHMQPSVPVSELEEFAATLAAYQPNDGSDMAVGYESGLYSASCKLLQLISKAAAPEPK